ncbi:hypothetical protein [Kitasatospora griseola]|uniref:hypothetical protein n=1 Tax=Kitasatospora griseola TaxID=2064 RepID=UPI00343501E6
MGVVVAWWNRKPTDRARWVLDPQVGVGPLRFGMDPQQVQDTLAEAGSNRLQYSLHYGRDGIFSEYYDEPGLTAFYGPGPGPRLTAVAVDAVGGPLVRLGEVELVDRVPSEASADLRRLALDGQVEVRANRYGEAEVPAWGISLNVAQGWGLSPEGYMQRQDTMVTGLLVTGPELAENLWDAAPVTDRPEFRDKPADPGPWPVTAGTDRPRWQCAPLQGVGPLLFGMSPQQVSITLNGEAPTGRDGYHPYPPHSPWAEYGDPEEWHLTEERYDRAGISAHYGHEEDGPELVGVSVHGRTGPQVLLDGIELIGRKPSAVEADITRYIQERELDLHFACSGDVGSSGLQVWVRAERAGDTLVSAAHFCIEDREYHG